MNKSFDEKNMAKSRRVCAAMPEAASTGKRVLTERERQILAMWPRFEDGEYVWFGDEFLCRCGKSHVCDGVRVQNTGAKVIFAANHPHNIFLKDGSEYSERVKRPAPKVLDADGVEIKVGDSMYVANYGDGPYIVCDIDENINRIELFWHENRNEKLFIAANRLTHTRPDSWERLEEDAELNDETGVVGGNLDIVRRAKALAGVEVD